MEQIKLNNYPLALIFKMAKNEINQIDFALCKQPRETLDSYYSRQKVKPNLMSNGGFFDMSNGDTVFTYVDEKKEISKSYLEYGMGVKNGQLMYGKNDGTFDDFINGYPVLIADGKPVSSTVGSELNYNARRTMLAYNNDYVFLIAIESPGYAYAKMKNLLLELGVDYGINLDGGGSTRVLKDGKLMTKSDVYNRPVDNVVCFYFNDKPASIYRVQAGAFSKKENAERLQKQIMALRDDINAGYAKAYVRVINNLYKVQIGAFSKKENATKVLNDLKSKGIDAFITTA